MRLSKKAAERIAELINAIQCSYICEEINGSSDTTQLMRDAPSIALADEFGIELPALSIHRARHDRRRREEQAARMSYAFRGPAAGPIVRAVTAAVNDGADELYRVNIANNEVQFAVVNNTLATRDADTMRDFARIPRGYSTFRNRALANIGI